MAVNVLEQLLNRIEGPGMLYVISLLKKRILIEYFSRTRIKLFPLTNYLF